MRRVQIDASLAQIKNQQEHTESAQVDPQDDFNNQMLIKALENPDGLLKFSKLLKKLKNLTKAEKYESKKLVTLSLSLERSSV